MTEEHNADNTVNRRRFVKTVGATGISVAGLSNVASASSDEEEPIPSTSLERNERKKTVGEIRSDENVKKVVKRLREQGWFSQFNDGTYKLLKPDKESSYRAAVIPFEKRGSARKRKDESREEQAILMWRSRKGVDKGQSRVAGHEFDQSKSAGMNPSDLKHIIYTVESGQIHAKTEYLSDYPDQSSADRGFTIQRLPDPPDCNCMYLDEYCNNYNWTCLGSIAITAGTCTYSLSLRCLGSAVGSSLLLYADDENCNICDNYVNRYKSVCDSPLYSC